MEFAELFDAGGAAGAINTVGIFAAVHAPYDQTAIGVRESRDRLRKIFAIVAVQVGFVSELEIEMQVFLSTVFDKSMNLSD